ncbi:MAG TPA: hypothetical protein VF902_02415 [Coriobacteriia bacterium]
MAGGGPATTPLPISVSEASYGRLSLRTAPGARCGADLRVAGGVYGELPPASLVEQAADVSGTVTWAYSAPRVPSGTASYTVTCHADAAAETKTGSFTIPTRPISPTSFTVRVTTDTPPHETFDPDPSLVPLRDASAAKMSATLATEWKTATRGLGSLQVVDSSADITIFVVASRNTSHWVQGSDDSEHVVVFVSGEIGPRNVENNVAVALHELGHIWCCRGPDTKDGHWLTKEASPGLYGVDKYGLMTDPVTCVSFGSVLSCPNRFSDREMTALGFTSFPPPAPDPCITQGLSLRSQINTLEAQLASLGGQVRAIELQYPSGIPPSIYDNYVSLVSQYNTLVGRRNTLVGQLNALPCDSS